LTREPFNINDKPLIEIGTEAYTDLINRMNSKKHIRKAIFVFKDGEFICRYDGVMAVAKSLKLSHNAIKESIVNNTTYKGYRFSYHRI
jgi:ssDNA-specific exonuclease RecJ